MPNEQDSGKHHAWVELYFDLVFVFAVGQLTHVIIAHPDWQSVLLDLGLFATLWWTWIGFVVLYNRHGEDRASERLLLLAGTVPCAIAAIEVHGAGEGHPVGFVLALAGTRLLLAVAYPLSAGDGRQVGREVGRRVGLGYAVTMVLFAVSALLRPPWLYVLWVLTLTLEAGFLLRAETGGSVLPDRSTGPPGPAVPRRAGRIVWLDRGPTDPSMAVNARHLAERFNLFMIIMLGEVVISVGGSASDVADHGRGYWLGIAAGLVLAGALWWIYFDTAAHMNEFLLRASGGNPAVAYGLYAVGYIVPTFSLLVIAAGCGLALQDEPPPATVWLVTIGLAGYLVGIRGFEVGRRGRRQHLLRVTVIAVTVSIALLHELIMGPAVVAVAAVWAVLVAAAMTRRGPWLPRRVTST